LQKLTRIGILLSLIYPLHAFAFGLGDITMHSALNEPLDAEIAIISARKLVAQDLEISLGSAADFAQAGVDRPIMLTLFKFTVEEREDGTPYIKVTSRQPVKEPFLDFLVAVDWSQGHLVREFTVLLDPPLTVEEAPAAVTAPVTQSPAAAAPAPAAAAPAAPAPSAAATPAPTASPSVSSTAPVLQPHITRDGVLSYGMVARNDTLWRIAEQLRPDDSVTIQQVMMALLKSNPEAFYGNNINNLKAGYVLRISDRSLLTAMSAEEAARESRLQYERWLDAKKRRAARAGKRPAGSQGTDGDDAGASTAAAGGPRLRLVVPDAREVDSALNGGSGTTVASGDLQAEVSRLRDQLATALESSETNRQENAELRQRLSELETQLAAMQRLVTLKDDTLAALQGGVATGDAAAKAGTTPMASQPADQTPTQVADAGVAAETAAVAPGTPAPTNPDQATPSAAKPDEVTPKPPAAPAPKPASVAKPTMAGEPVATEGALATILNDPNLMKFGAGGLLLLAIVGWLVVRRRRMAHASLEDFAAVPASGGLGAAGAAFAGGVAAIEAGVEEEDAAGGADEDELVIPQEADLDAMHADEEEIDILSEADVYLAYRRFDKAEELLKEAIESDPDRHELTLKLLEVYEASGNTDGFVSQAEALKAKLSPLDDEVWSKVQAMGSSVAPHHALFGGSGEALADSAVSGGERNESPSEGSELDTELDTDLDSLDFGADLDLDLGDLDDASSDDLDLDTMTHSAHGLEDVSGAAAETASAEGESFTSGASDIESLGLSEPASDDSASEIDFDLSSLELDETPSGIESTDEEPLVAANNAELDEAAEALTLDSSAEELTLDTATEDLTLDNEEAEGNGGLELETSAASEADTGITPADGPATGSGPDLDWLSSDADDITALDQMLADGDAAGEDLISGEDEVSTKLDLAKAYIDMGDNQNARNILDDVVSEGNDDQQREAQELIAQIS